MDHYRPDDLLLKSQILISKFRKQREASLKKQDYLTHRSVKNEPTFNGPHLSSYHNSIPEYLSLQQLHKYSPRNPELSSNVSIWSDGPPTPPNETGPKKDCAVNTEEDDDILTPITALPTLTSRPPPATQIPICKYASICTQVIQQHQQNEDSEPETVHTLDVRSDQAPSYDEDSEIGRALNLYQEEKRLETDIANQEAQIIEITNEMLRMVEKIEKEKVKLEHMKLEKQQVSAKRLEIFTGLTQQIQQRLQMPPVINNDSNNGGTSLQPNCIVSPSKLDDSSHNHLTLPQPHAELTQNNVSLIQSNQPVSYNLDKRTITKIIHKVIDNDVSCTDDDELVTNFINNSTVPPGMLNGVCHRYLPQQHNQSLSHSYNGAATIDNKVNNTGEDGALSDVMSIKDLSLLLPQSPGKSNSKTSRSSTHSTATIINTSLANGMCTNAQKSMSLRTAQSMDNLVSPKRRRRTNSYRNNIRSPAVSEGHRLPRQPVRNNHHPGNLFTDDSSDTM